MKHKVYIVNNTINNMINKTPQEIILKGLRKEGNMSISDMVRYFPLSRCRVRTAISFLLGSKEIVEQKFGMAKIYFISEDSE